MKIRVLAAVVLAGALVLSMSGAEAGNAGHGRQEGQDPQPGRPRAALQDQRQGLRHCSRAGERRRLQAAALLRG